MLCRIRGAGQQTRSSSSTARTRAWPAATWSLVHPRRWCWRCRHCASQRHAGKIEQLLPTLQALRTRGFRLAFSQDVLRRAYGSWLPLANFIKLDMLAIKPELIEPLVKYVRPTPRPR